MKLPLINTSGLKKSGSQQIITKKYKIVDENRNESQTLANSFIEKLNKINEIKIFLNSEFNKGDIDDEFMKDIENEYAEQYLTKVELFPTKKLISKLLKIKPIESCEFHMTSEMQNINGIYKNIKVVHIYPGVIDSNKKKFKINKSASVTTINKKNSVLKNIESVININKKKSDPQKEMVSLIKKNNKNNKDNLVFNKEKVDSLINEAKENILEAKFLNIKNLVFNVDLAPDNIREKYIVYRKNNEEVTSNRIYCGKGRLLNISKSVSLRKNILNDEKYIFPVNQVKNLTSDILKEITEPLETQIELIIKDMNYILDNFPINEFINVGKDIDKEKIGEDNDKFVYKININDNSDILRVLKILHSNNVFKIVGLTLNLIYWIVFGSINNIQIDNCTKQLIYLKILKEVEILINTIKDNKLLYEVFLPMLIIILRIEADNYFSRKFVYLFANQENKVKSMSLINDIISEIYDKHGYMNSFITIAGKSKELKEKMIKNLLPRFKGKSFATSNYLEQIFCNDTSDIHVLNGKVDSEDIEQRKKFIIEQKTEFISEFLKKMNNNLSKRHLKPIFSIKDKNSIGNYIAGVSLNRNNLKNLTINQLYNNNIRYNKNSVGNFSEIEGSKSIGDSETKFSQNDNGIDNNENEVI